MEILRLAEASPPGALKAFRASPVRPYPLDDVPVAWFEVSCRGCEGAQFSVAERLVHWRTKSGDKQIGDIGIALSCTRCGKNEVLFDARRHGYDGEHGHNHFLVGPEIDKPLVVPTMVEELNSVSIRTGLFYNIELSDLQADAHAHSKLPQDFFDWVVVEANARGEWLHVWDMECA
jgi:hypothetical protein